MRAVSLDHNMLAADLVWLEAVNYFGGRDGAEHRYVRLAGLLDVATTLDPEFREAYLFGGLALSSAFGGLEEADNLLIKGQHRFLQDWRFPFYLGFNALIFRDDMARAARFFNEAAVIKGSPGFLVGLGPRLQMASGDCEQSLKMLDDMQAGSTDQLLLTRVQQRRDHIIWECNFQIIEKASQDYTSKHGSAAPSLGSLIQAGLLPTGGLLDPYGGQWSIAGDGTVVSSTARTRLRLRLPREMIDRIKQW